MGKLNLESLKSSFIAYLQDKGMLKDEDLNNINQLSFSIFKYAKEFKEYVQKEMAGKVDIKSLTVSDILNMDIKDEQTEADGTGEEAISLEGLQFAQKPQNDDKTAETEVDASESSEKTDETEETDEAENPENLDDTAEQEEDENLLTQIFNDLLENEEFFKALDKDGNNEISTEEKTKFFDLIKDIDGNKEDISFEDILDSAIAVSEGKLYEYAQPSPEEETPSETVEQPSEETPSAEPEKPAAQPETTTPQTTGTQSTGNDSGSNGSNNVNNNNNTNTDNNQSTEQAETLEELQKQRDEKQTELGTARSDLQTLYSSGKEDVNKAKEEYNDAVQKDEAISDELKEKQKNNIEAYSAKEKEIDSLKSDLVGVNSTIKDNESVKTSKESEISAIEASLNSLDPNGPNYSQLKSDLDSKLAKAKSDKKDAGDKIDAANTQKTKIEKEITEKEKELEALKTEKAEIESKISENASQTTKDVFAKYLEAQKTYETNIQNAETKIDSLQNEIKELDEKINKKQAENIKNEHVQTKLNQKYTLNGKEYLSLLSQDELDKFLANEWANGNYNKNSNCLAMSNLYCKDLIRKLHLPAKNSYDFIDDSREAVEKKAKEMLDKGYPVTLHVSTYRGTRHFETAVGYRINEKGNIEFLCADNVRGVGISTCGEDGSRRHLITGYSTPYSDQNYGYRCLYYC